MSEGRTRSIRAWSAGLGIVTLLAVAGAAPATAQTPITTMAYISPEAATDYGWNQQGLIAAQAAADGIGATLIDASDSGYGDPAPILAQLKEDGAQFIVAQASGYTTTAAQFAKDNNIPVIVFDQPYNRHVAGVRATTWLEIEDLVYESAARRGVALDRQLPGFDSGADRLRRKQ